jgi:acyl carrier protein
LSGIDDRLEAIGRSIFYDDDLTFTDATRAADVPGWDSLAHVSFMYAVEDEFGVRFSEDEFTGFADIAELKRMIERKQAA